jgi:DNA-binding transcriptional LysR family regulator
MKDELEGLSVFVVVAETLSFRGASERLGVTRSAVSQSIGRLEARLGVALLQRTTRSVRLTEAGERLLDVVRPMLSDVSAAIAALGELAAEPTGTLRLAVSSIAESFLTGTVLASFLVTHPKVSLDIFVTDDEFDIVAHGFDAGVRLGEVIEQDMIAVSVSAPQRQMAVAAPDYLARAGTPSHPRDLSSHDCIGWRPSPQSAPYRWEFTEHGTDFDVAVRPRVTTNDMDMMLRLALAGAGLTFGMEETFRPYLARGDLRPALEAFCPPFPGFYLYYPGRRNLPAKLRALVDHLKARRRRV